MVVSETRAGIVRELMIIAADCSDPHGRVGCDNLTMGAVERLTEHVKDLVAWRAIWIEPV